MKILFCIGSLERGGAERVISNLANAFATENDISIVTTIEKNEYEINKNVHLYSLTKKSNKGDLYSKFAKLFRLKKTIKDINPDIIVAFLRDPIFRLMLLRPWIKCPIIISVRNDPQKEYDTFVAKVFLKFFYPKADGFVFQTRDAQNFFDKKIQNKSIIIPNPIKKEFLNREYYTGTRKNKIVAVGRLEPQKNHELLIEAFYELKDKLKDYKLVIYGEGSLRNFLEEKIKDLNMQERILLPGTVGNIAEMIEDAKLYVMTSDYEGMPNSLMESMALGLICISTDCPCGGPKFLIDDKENGFLFEVGNKEELKVKMLQVLNEFNEDILQQISKSAREKTKDLKEEKINNKWYNYICNVEKEYKRGKEWKK